MEGKKRSIVPMVTPVSPTVAFYPGKKRREMGGISKIIGGKQLRNANLYTQSK
jgi:hypothetical protein